MRQLMKVLAMVTLLLGLTLTAFRQPPTPKRADHLAVKRAANHGEGATARAAAQVTVTRRISVPFGFNSPLPLLDSGTRVRTSGHGGCTAGDLVTIAVTVTQTSTGAIATGTKEQTCTGQEQSWWLMATTETITPMAEAPVETCGLAQTREMGTVVFNDSFEWCVGVDLLALEQQTYLPLIQP